LRQTEKEEHHTGGKEQAPDPVDPSNIAFAFHSLMFGKEEDACEGNRIQG
jgi:hypothetical protein